MLYNNPSFIEKLVQAKRDDTLREIHGFYEHEFLNTSKPILKSGIRPKVLRFVGAIAFLAWLVIIIS